MQDGHVIFLQLLTEGGNIDESYGYKRQPPEDLDGVRLHHEHLGRDDEGISLPRAYLA